MDPAPWPSGGDHHAMRQGWAIGDRARQLEGPPYGTSPSRTRRFNELRPLPACGVVLAVDSRGGHGCPEAHLTPRTGKEDPGPPGRSWPRRPTHPIVTNEENGMGRQKKGVDVLLVEDDPDHAELTLRDLKDGNLLNEIFWVKDGEEALDFLYHRGRYADSTKAPRPGLFLLDIRLPKVDGHEVLRQLKADEDLRAIPVIMLTTSERQDEVCQSYQAGANSFVSKPVRFADFVERVKNVKLYWVLTNLLPDPESGCRAPL